METETPRPGCRNFWPTAVGNPAKKRRCSYRLVRFCGRYFASPTTSRAGWWFGTFGLFSISYMGCHPSHWRTPSCFKMVFSTTNQITIYIYNYSYIYIYIQYLLLLTISWTMITWYQTSCVGVSQDDRRSSAVGRDQVELPDALLSMASQAKDVGICPGWWGQLSPRSSKVDRAMGQNPGTLRP